MRTIRQQLLIYLFGGMVTATIIASIATYIEVRIETNELFDYQLKQIAAALPDEIASGHNLPVDSEADEEVAVQVWNKDGTLCSRLDQHSWFHTAGKSVSYLLLLMG